MAPHLPRTILVIDDEPSVVRALSGLLRREGYVVGTASNGRHALAQLQVQPYDVILCDLRMPELDGPAFYDLLTRQYPTLRQRVIFLTGDTLSGESQQFLEQCGQLWVPKPCHATEIRSAIAQVPHNATKDMAKNNFPDCLSCSILATE